MTDDDERQVTGLKIGRQKEVPRYLRRAWKAATPQRWHRKPEAVRGIGSSSFDVARSANGKRHRNGLGQTWLHGCVVERSGPRSLLRTSGRHVSAAKDRVSYRPPHSHLLSAKGGALARCVRVRRAGCLRGRADTPHQDCWPLRVHAWRAGSGRAVHPCRLGRSEAAMWKDREQGYCRPARSQRRRLPAAVQRWPLTLRARGRAGDVCDVSEKTWPEGCPGTSSARRWRAAPQTAKEPRASLVPLRDLVNVH